MVNACSSAEGTDEYIIYQNGNFDTYVDSLSITFPSAGTFCNNGCGTNTLLNNPTYINQLNTTAGCPGLFVFSDTIPANAQVIVFTGNPPSYTMDFSSQCGAGPFYAIFCNNTNTGGRFANSGGNRTTAIDFSSTCSDAVTYYASSANTGTDGDYVDFDAAGNPYYKNNANCAVPLPVELIYFTGQVINEDLTLLTWATASEINNDYFAVEHSNNGLDVNIIGHVPGNGNSNYVQEYEFYYDGNTENPNYFRLKQVDFNGNFEYSEIIVIEGINNNLGFYFDNNTKTLFFTGINDDLQNISIYDVSGKVVYTSNINSGNKIILSHLQSGIYIINMNNSFNSYRQKIVIE